MIGKNKINLLRTKHLDDLGKHLEIGKNFTVNPI